jgi:hypothetical protein
MASWFTSKEQPDYAKFYRKFQAEKFGLENNFI